MGAFTEILENITNTQNVVSVFRYYHKQTKNI